MRLLPHALAFAALVLAACLPVTSKVPVGITIGFKPDPVLLGTWKARDPDGGAPSYVHIVGNDDGTMTAILVTPPHKGNLGEWSAYKLRAATLGGNRILNAQELFVRDKASEGLLAERHVVLLYRATGARHLALFQMDEKEAAAAIRAHEIAGDIEPGQDGDVHITASEPALDAFMKTPRATELFNKTLVTLTRVD